MSERAEDGRRLYKVRRPDGEEAWVDHDELWRLQQRQAEEARRGQERRRRRLLLALGGVAGLALVVALLGLWLAGSSGPGRGPVRATAGPAESSPTHSAGAVGGSARDGADATGAARRPGSIEPDPAAVSPPPPAAAPSPEERVRAAVRAWAEAWQAQEVASYLAGYATAFEPPGGLSREAWKRLRRSRLQEPESIRVEIEQLEIEVGDGGQAVARFRQRYRSPRYADVVRKTLRLVREDGEWRILSERAEPLRGAALSAASATGPAGSRRPAAPPGGG